MFKNKIRIVIATNQYLIRIGIQALIKHIGIEPEYIEIDNLDDFNALNLCEDDFLIIHHRKLLKPKKLHLIQLQKSFKGNLLIIGNEVMDENFHPQILLPDDSKTEIIEKLQDFFSAIKSKDQIADNGVISAREIDILKEVALGYSNKEIADRLFISINTVITHRKNLTEKLGIKTISGLTVYALMNNLINPDDVTV